MKYIYVDFENVRKFDLTKEKDCKVLLFVGENDKKLSLDLIRELQPLGDKVEYIQIDGNGRNALDFHIAYYLSEYSSKPNSEHIIVSKDKGYDPLIRHVQKKGVQAKRVVTLGDASVSKAEQQKLPSSYGKVKASLLKAPKSLCIMKRRFHLRFSEAVQFPGRTINAAMSSDWYRHF